MKIPDDTTPLADIVAFMMLNDRNGNWPEHYTSMGQRTEDIGERSPSPDHVWYDWEGDKWYTDEECRAQLLPILNEWRNDL